MKAGDFCFVPREDGRFALFVYLCAQGSSRSYFYGALSTNVVDAADLDAVPPEITIGEHALVHIKCFRENATPIYGNLADRIGPTVFSDVINVVNDTGIGSKHKVWGSRTIVKYANTVHN